MFVPAHLELKIHSWVRTALLQATDMVSVGARRSIKGQSTSASGMKRLRPVRPSKRTPTSISSPQQAAISRCLLLYSGNRLVCSVLGGAPSVLPTKLRAGTLIIG